MQTLGEILKKHPYPGRGIAIGRAGKNFCIAYFLMGRSENSRNRIFTIENGELFTKPFDEEKIGDTSLIVYRALRSYKKNTVITNGNHTDTIYDGLRYRVTFEDSLATCTFEPDPPIFTPRISGIVTTFSHNFNYKLSILKKAAPKSNYCNQFTYSYSPIDNLGHFIHTYKEDPELSFDGEPLPIYIPNDMHEFANDIWDNLNEDNKISLYVRYGDYETGEFKDVLINKNK